MAGFFKKALPWLGGGLLSKGGRKFLTGSPEKHENVSTLRPEQEQGFQNLQDAANGRGASGAFGEAADYYRNNLSDNPADFAAFAAPGLRQYNEEIVPGISEQFAGMGSGGLSSSGFRNAQIQGATDLSERLGALRANLRHSSAQGLQGIGQASLGNFSKDAITEQGSEGLLAAAAPAIGTAIGSFAGPAGTAAGNAAGNWFKNSMGGNKVGQNSSPYGSGQPQASPGGGFRLPNFMER
jgi:hypothetical protein